MSHYVIEVVKDGILAAITSYDTDSETLDFASDLLAHASTLDNDESLVIKKVVS